MISSASLILFSNVSMACAVDSGNSPILVHFVQFIYRGHTEFKRCFIAPPTLDERGKADSLRPDAKRERQKPLHCAPRAQYGVSHIDVVQIVQTGAETVELFLEHPDLRPNIAELISTAISGGVSTSHSKPSLRSLQVIRRGLNRNLRRYKFCYIL